MTNSVHDMGGMHGFGAIPREADEAVFHADWERTVFGLMMAGMGTLQVNIDFVRSQMEATPPVEYVQLSYYELWLRTLETIAVAKGVISAGDLSALARGADIGLEKTVDPIPPEGLAGFVAAGANAARPLESPARFKVGDRVRTKTDSPATHTRLPRYARGHVGEIIRDAGGQIYPDSNAVTGNEGPERLYSVRFTARELWGENANAKDTVIVDLWEPYLEAAV
jgi:nitrile hydratase beta subunit